LYACKMAATTKSGLLEGGMRLLTLSLVFLLLSIIADIVSDFGFLPRLFNTAREVILALFILVMLLGMMKMVRDASNFLRLVQP